MTKQELQEAFDARLIEHTKPLDVSLPGIYQYTITVDGVQYFYIGKTWKKDDMTPRWDIRKKEYRAGTVRLLEGRQYRNRHAARAVYHAMGRAVLDPNGIIRLDLRANVRLDGNSEADLYGMETAIARFFKSKRPNVLNGIGEKSLDKLRAMGIEPFEDVELV